MAFSVFGKKDEPRPKKDQAKAGENAPKKAPQVPNRAPPQKGREKPPPPVFEKESIPQSDEDLSLDFSNYVPPPRGEKPPGEAVKQPSEPAKPPLAAARPQSPGVKPPPVVEKPLPAAAISASAAAKPPTAAEKAAPAAAKPPPAAARSPAVAETPAAERPVPGVEKLPPEAEKPAPAATKPRTADEKPARAAEKASPPVAKKPPPRAEVLPPIAEESAPAADEPSPDAEESAPATEGLPHDAEIPLPGAEESQPVAEPPPAQPRPKAAPAAPEPPPAKVAPEVAKRAVAEPAAQEPKEPARAAPVTEEAALMFADGEVWQALAVLTDALREDAFGPSPVPGWLMLFELYQHLGMKRDFELLALQFAVEFERSPPMWAEDETQSGAEAASAETAHRELTGTLSAGNVDQLEQLLGAAHPPPALRLDFSGIQGIEADGCARLLEVLGRLDSYGTELVLSGEEGLLGALEAACETGGAETDGAVWSLLFETLRVLGLEERFEEAAINYALTFEVSPPAWERKQESRPKARATVMSAEPAEPAFTLQGELTGSSESLPKKMLGWAAKHAVLVVDISKVRRIDPAAAAQLHAIFVRLYQKGATIEIRGANELVAVLLEVIGVGEVARIIRRI